VCSSYPTHVIVPRQSDDATIIKSSKFRAHGRFPVLSYFHKHTKNILFRSSQPLCGSSNKRCKEDELFLKSFLAPGKKGYIYDLRDANILKYAASKGGGYETEANYSLWKRVNIHLDRFDQLQSSFVKLIDACLDSNSDSKFYAKLDASNWFLNQRQAIYTACCIVDELHNKNGCVLVHGWDGMDNTLLITSLVQILLDPDCRTLSGFERLIEREWLQAGHPFSHRCFKSAFGSTAQKQEGPTFLLFLDCVRQIQEQFCLSFEFNEELLIALFDCVYAPEYGTFIGNCERERGQLDVKQRTNSFWSFINAEANSKTFQNPLYERNSAALWPSLYNQTLTIWSNLFLRYQANTTPWREALCEMRKLVDDNHEARRKLDTMKSEYAQLEEEARRLGIILTTEFT
jgi:myotubularin-related protein 9